MIYEYINNGTGLLNEKGHETIRGALTGHAVSMNREYIDSISIEFRLLDGPTVPDTSLEVFGQKLNTPIMSAALSGLGGIAPSGMVKTATGVNNANSCMWIGICEKDEFFDITQNCDHSIRIVKPYNDINKIKEHIKEAEQAGCLAVGMDIDHFYGGEKGDSLIATNAFSPKSPDELADIINSTNLPFIIKGILSVHDARRALELGASAIVLSHHSGNVLDYAIPPMKLLPDIASEVGDRAKIFIDGDIRSGTDVFKALALGADGVLVGRALMAGLIQDGSDGIQRVIDGMTYELKRAMCLTGCNSLKDIDRTLLHKY